MKTEGELKMLIGRKKCAVENLKHQISNLEQLQEELTTEWTEAEKELAELAEKPKLENWDFGIAPSGRMFIHIEGMEHIDAASAHTEFGINKKHVKGNLKELLEQGPNVIALTNEELDNFFTYAIFADEIYRGGVLAPIHAKLKSCRERQDA